MDEKCEIESCGEDAQFRDEMENLYCEEHMERAVSEEGMSLDEFEAI